MNIKKIGIGLDWSSYSELKEHHVASQGWNEYGDLSFMFHNSKELWRYIDIVSGWTQPGKNAIRQIMLDIKAHDIILAFEGNSVKGIAEVPEKFIYYHAKEIESYQNCIFPLNWVDWEDFCDNKSIKGQGGQGVHGIENCNSPQNLVDYIRNNWENYKNIHGYMMIPDECVDKMNDLFVNFEEQQRISKINFLKLLNKNNNIAMISKYVNLLCNNRNLILTGAPGTGKTYLAKQIARALGAEGEKYGFVQFHPSYDYSDFIEGLRPIKNDATKEIGFERKDGIFMSFCRKALKAYKSVDNKNDAPKYVFVIDEINRGEMSKIFGELFFSIDPGYRGVEGRITTQYANLWSEKDMYDASLSDDDRYKFYIPENVYIIGTMNDIDRSVESMDFAMRRRFAFKEIKAETRLQMINENNNLNSFFDQIKERMANLNLCILTIQGLSSAYQIGASYYLKLENYLTNNKVTNESWTNLWDNHLSGLLFEYLRGMPDAEKTLNEMLYNAYTLKDKYAVNDGIVIKLVETNDNE